MTQSNNELKEEAEKANNLVETIKSENAVFAAKIEELQNTLAESKNTSTEESLMIEENKRMIKELEEELNQSKELETELTKRYETEIENNKQIMKKNEQELTEMNERIS
ncbi:hypothetical protein [Vagococcus fluvialis]|uniref:hypothetical protein n=1 Tax=Vagococcus fluvialis TaxID=2738 RepID=UPI003B5C8C02